MTIETKYNIGDEVWVILKNKAQKIRITGISTYAAGTVMDGYYCVMEAKCDVRYYFADGECCYESDCFPTKEELIKSL